MYYRPATLPAMDAKVLLAIDMIHTARPFLGSRRIVDELADAGRVRAESLPKPVRFKERAPAWVLDQLLTSERAARFERRVNANLKLSGIPNRCTTW